MKVEKTGDPNGNTYQMDVKMDTGEIIVTFTANVKGVWGIISTIMDRIQVDLNKVYIQEQYDIFKTEALNHAEANGLTPFL